PVFHGESSYRSDDRCLNDFKKTTITFSVIAPVDCQRRTATPQSTGDPSAKLTDQPATNPVWESELTADNDAAASVG
ncbi:MAG TPA: hypothetical protein VGL78_01465, partial [Solirubrobacteraceae bacterium]